MHHRKLCTFCCVLTFVCFAFCVGAAEQPKKIILIAGPITGHPKEAHEYEKNVILLKHLLDTSPNLQGKVKVEAHFKGWPENPSTLDDADTIFIPSDGTDQKETNHPLYVGDHLQAIERQMKRGCGLVLFHWSTFNPVRVHDQITEWVGGYFDYETGPGPRKWYSAIQTWDADSLLGAPQHPISRGVKPFKTREEYYYRLRFRDADPRLVPIVRTRPPNEKEDFTVGWTVERADGGRGFGFTGGHFYANWWNADFRKLILNAIVWTAKLEVPEGGVQSEPFERFKALILTGHNHPAHDWRATTAALILALEQDPRAIVHVTENMEDLATDKLNAYDLLVMNYNNWDRPGLSEAAKANLVKYLNAGGGLAVIHFANGAFNPTLPNKDSDWPEYRTKIVRRAWMAGEGRSGHDSYGPFLVEITSVKHPITAGLQPFDTIDELYFRQEGELPIQALATSRSKVTGKDEPMAWAYDYGNGRIFQTVLGHADVSTRKAAALIRRGSVWAGTRNPLSFDPPRELTEGALFRDGSTWTPQQSQKRAASVPSAEKNESSAQAKKSASIAAPEVGRAVLSAPRATATGDDGALRTARPTESRPAGTPGIAGREPGDQAERDWIDNRWSRTEVGQFLASSLRVPSGTVAKALTIRVGEHDEASVCYDTANLNVRAGWTGGFLKLDPARFGLINPPKLNGDVQFVAPADAGWIGATGRLSGFHVNGKRVVLECQIGETTVRESPWFVRTNELRVFVRAFEIGPAENTLKLRLPASADKLHAVAKFDPQAVVETRGDSLTITIPPHAAKLRGKVFLWPRDSESQQTEASTIEALSEAENLEALSAAGPPRWLPALETTGQIAPDTNPLAIDTLTVPYANPWNALMFLSGVDFTSDGTAYVCSIYGDVWKVIGIDDKLRKLTWKRFATGLYQPLGLKVVNDQLYVLGRDQITRLHDQNGDGEADFYENFCNQMTTQPGHYYVTSLETDTRGNFYYVDPAGVHRVSPDGRATEKLATGFRNPNGAGVSPDGNIVTVAPQQGEWTPSSAIVEARRGGHYGYGGPKVTPERPLGYDPPLCWIPHSADNSGGSQVWVPHSRTGVAPVPRNLARTDGADLNRDQSAGTDWGPLASHMLHFSWGRCTMMLVLRDVVDGVSQGAVIALPGRFLSGAMRGAFNPRDGHLYVVGSTGWQTSALKDGCLQRVRYTGKPLYLPAAWHVYRNGLTLTFSQPLDKQTAEDVGSYGIKQWNYRYAAQYGSKDWSVADPSKEGHDQVDVRSARLLADGRTVFLEIPNLKPVMQMQVQYNLNAKDGTIMRDKIYATVNRAGPGFELAKP